MHCYHYYRYDEDSDPRNDHLDNRVTTELAPDLTNGDILCAPVDSQAL